jgi:TolB-like protein
MNMKFRRAIAAILCLTLCVQGLAQAEDIDKALVTLADKLAASTKEQGKKKVAVLDFTDLQGESTELGRYIAEQLTANLVMSKRDFSVLDRANLKSILAEHKLTAKGLIDPENAKKLGMFAGVDALILGTMVHKKENISLTAKVITTDTAEIVGAARAEFTVDETVKQLESAPNLAKDATVSEPSSPTSITRPFGDLQAKASVILLPGDNIYGYATMALTIFNTSDSKTYGVALEPDFYNKLNLSNSRGDEFKVTEVHGIETAFQGGNGMFMGQVSDVPPKSSIIITAKSQMRWNGRPGEYRPYRLQTVVIFGIESQGRHPELKKYNLVQDVN